MMNHFFKKNRSVLAVSAALILQIVFSASALARGPAHQHADDILAKVGAMKVGSGSHLTQQNKSSDNKRTKPSKQRQQSQSSRLFSQR
jgi:hypothetical protein